MHPILFEKNETNFETLGLGILSECTQCSANEALNGKYELSFSYPLNGKLYEKIVPDRIIKIKANESQGPQLFRIYRVSKPINGIVKFFCQHISYDLNMLIVKPFGDQLGINATTALNTILNNTVYSHNFTAVSDIATEKNVVSSAPQSVRKWLGTSDGAINNLYGGEYEFDNYIIRLKQNRGQDKGVKITYGKNLSNVNAETNIESTYTSIYPYAFTSNGTYMELPEKIIELSNADQYGEKRTFSLDLSNMFDKDEIVTPSKLRTKALNYASKNNIDQILQNIKVEFVHLWQSTEYESLAALERVDLGDYVTVKYPELGVDATAKVISYQYNCLEERYDHIELGEAKPNMAATLNKINTMENKIASETSARQKAVSNATKLITGGLGGFVVITQNESTGYPEEILIMDTASKETATNVIRMNKNGIGFSTTGYNGKYSTAWTIDGSFVADFITSGNLNADLITTGTLNADLIKSGTLQDQAGITSINLSNGQFKIKLDNSSFVEMWSNGLTFYGQNDEVLTSMFISKGEHGVVTANSVLVGQRDNEKTAIGVINGEGYVITENLRTENLWLGNTINIRGAQGKIVASVPVVADISLIDANNNEVGCFYRNASGGTTLKTNNIYVNGEKYIKTNITVDNVRYSVLALDSVQIV